MFLKKMLKLIIVTVVSYYIISLIIAQIIFVVLDIISPGLGQALKELLWLPYTILLSIIDP